MQRRKFLRDSLLVGATLPSLVACFGGDGGGGDVDGDDGNENNDNERSWQPHTLKLFEQMTKDIDKSVRMTGSGSTRRPLGKFPSKWKGLVSPSNDPLSFF